MPLQNEPNANQGWFWSSRMILGSMAFQPSWPGVDSMTLPRSIHLYFGLAGSRIALTTWPMQERLRPKVETE